MSAWSDHPHVLGERLDRAPPQVQPQGAGLCILKHADHPALAGGFSFLPPEANIARRVGVSASDCDADQQFTEGRDRGCQDAARRGGHRVRKRKDYGGEGGTNGSFKKHQYFLLLGTR